MKISLLSLVIILFLKCNNDNSNDFSLKVHSANKKIKIDDTINISVDNKNEIKIDLDQIKDFSKELIKNQMKQYGQLNPDEKELESISKRILSNKDEVKRISDQLLSQKLISLFKSELKFKTNKVSYEKFIEMAYSKN